QRVAIARALAGSPRLLLADEPTGNLDSLMARGVMELLEEINEQGTTIVMVTHDPELARRAQRNVHVIDGQVTDIAEEPRIRVAAAGPRAGGGDLHVQLLPPPRTAVAEAQPHPDRADGGGDRTRHRRRHDLAHRAAPDERQSAGRQGRAGSPRAARQLESGLAL